MATSPASTAAKPLAALDDVAKRHDPTPAQVALAWLMSRLGVVAPIASATSAAQVAELADATTLALSEDDLTRFEQIGG